MFFFTGDFYNMNETHTKTSMLKMKICVTHYVLLYVGI